MKEKLQKNNLTDYSFLIELDEMSAKILLSVLDNNDIPNVSVPTFGTGITVRTGCVEHYKIYVPYEYYQQAKQLVDENY